MKLFNMRLKLKKLRYLGYLIINNGLIAQSPNYITPLIHLGNLWTMLIALLNKSTLFVPKQLNQA